MVICNTAAAPGVLPALCRLLYLAAASSRCVICLAGSCHHKAVLCGAIEGHGSLHALRAPPVFWAAVLSIDCKCSCVGCAVVHAAYDGGCPAAWAPGSCNSGGAIALARHARGRHLVGLPVKAWQIQRCFNRQKRCAVGSQGATLLSTVQCCCLVQLSWFVGAEPFEYPVYRFCGSVMAWASTLMRPVSHLAS